jgi:hypothetical protein
MQDINLKSKNSLVISSMLLALLPLREQPSFDKILKENQSTKLISTKGIPFKQKVLQKRNNLYKKGIPGVRKKNSGFEQGSGFHWLAFGQSGEKV